MRNKRVVRIVALVLAVLMAASTGAILINVFVNM